MQFDKVSLFYVAADATIRVETIVSANGESCRIDGVPLIEITGETVQLGCVRITRSALNLLQYIARTSGEDVVVQKGDYKTADPNTRK